MYKKTNDKWALITGSSGDIGMACAEMFVKNNFNIILHSYKSPERADEFIKKHKKANILHINCDASSEKEVNEQFYLLKKKFGIKKINVLVNNAGDLLERRSFDEMDWDLMQRSINVNVKSAFLFTKNSLPYFSKNSSIILISSLTSRCGKGDRSSAYGMSKGALISWAKSLANELGPKGIRVNVITPGFIKGRFHKKFTSPEVEKEHAARNPLGRVGTPHDVAEAVLFFASVTDGYISGTTLDVCGADYMC